MVNIYVRVSRFFTFIDNFSCQWFARKGHHHYRHHRHNHHQLPSERRLIWNGQEGTLLVQIHLKPNWILPKYKSVMLQDVTDGVMLQDVGEEKLLKNNQKVLHLNTLARGMGEAIWRNNLISLKNNTTCRLYFEWCAKVPRLNLSQWFILHYSEENWIQRTFLFTVTASLLLCDMKDMGGYWGSWRGVTWYNQEQTVGRAQDCHDYWYPTKVKWKWSWRVSTLQTTL